MAVYNENIVVGSGVVGFAIIKYLYIFARVYKQHSAQQAP